MAGVCFVLGTAWSLLATAADPPTLMRFEDRTQQSGLSFKHENASSGRRYLIEYMGAGLACFDADNDGWLDLYLLNGSELPGANFPRPPTDALFRNLHAGNFVDVTRPANCAETGYGLGVTTADYDNDGFQDIYINNFGPNRLLHNNGDGTFTDVTAVAQVSDGSKFGAGATFVDIDQDGDLDLFSANYLEFSFDRHDVLAPSAFPFSPGPRDFPAAVDTLFLNQGDGTFADISQTSGIASVAGPSMGIVAGDFDLDGDSDIFVACDGAANLLYINTGRGEFTEDALLRGVAYDLRGNANGNMGVDAADLNGDTLEDLFITDYSDQLPIYFQNSVGGLFEDVSRPSQIGSEVLPHVCWGTGLVDFDRDGDRDVFICSGHLLINAQEIDPRTDYAVHNTVMENVDNQIFRSVTAAVGSALQQALSSRGAALDDLDNDGDVDVVVLNCGAAAQLLINQSQDKHHWIEIELRGRRCSRDAIGSQVRIITAGKVQSAELHNGRGYQSQYGSRLHFGLANAASIDRIEINWFGGGPTQVLQHVTVDQILTVLQP